MVYVFDKSLSRLGFHTDRPLSQLLCHPSSEHLACSATLVTPLCHYFPLLNVRHCPVERLRRTSVVFALPHRPVSHLIRHGTDAETVLSVRSALCGKSGNCFVHLEVTKLPICIYSIKSNGYYYCNCSLIFGC